MHRGSYYAPRPISLPSASSCCSCCLRVDSFHLIKGQLFVYLFICLFPVYSHSHGRWLDVHLITMRRWYGTPSDAPICSQGRGHKKLSCGYRSHCKDRWLWNVQRHLCFGLLQGKPLRQRWKYWAAYINSMWRHRLLNASSPFKNLSTLENVYGNIRLR